MKSSFKTVALVGKYKSPEVVAPLLKLARFLERRKVEVLMDRVAGSRAGRGRYPVLPLEELGRRADLAIVIGGDGTMLNIARALAPHDVPLIGVNQGQIGFLTDISVETMIGTIGSILDGKFVTEKRMLLEGRIRSRSQKASRVLAFNDVVVSKGARGNMVELEVRIDGEFIYNQRSDGLIVATPTGSTAYAMSAGGPIVHPRVDAIILTPIASHTLTNRPIVIPGSEVIDVRPYMEESAEEIYVTYDGQSGYPLQKGDSVRIRALDRRLRLIKAPERNYFELLREKLKWGER